MLEEYLVQSCKKVNVVRNKYGGYVEGIGTILNCRFREITTMRRNARGEIYDSDGMFWFAPSTNLVKGDILLFEGIFYQIERIWNARRLGESIAQFLKCDVKIIDIANS